MKKLVSVLLFVAILMTISTTIVCADNTADPTNYVTVSFKNQADEESVADKSLIYQTTAGTMDVYFYTMNLPYGSEINTIEWDADSTYASRMYAGLTQVLNPDAGVLPTDELYLTNGEFTDGTTGHVAYKAQYNRLSDDAKAAIKNQDVKGFVIASTVSGVAQEIIFVQIYTSSNPITPNYYSVIKTGNVASDITAPRTAAEFESYTFTLTIPRDYGAYPYEVSATVDGDAVPLERDDSSYSQNYTVTYTIGGDYVSGDIEITANRSSPYSFSLPDGTALNAVEYYGSGLYTVVEVPAGTESIVVSRENPVLKGVYGKIGIYNYYVAASDADWTQGEPWENATYDAEADAFTVPFRELENREGEAEARNTNSAYEADFDDFTHYLLRAGLQSDLTTRAGNILIRVPREIFDVNVEGTGAEDVTYEPTVKEFWNYSFTVDKDPDYEYTVTATMGETELELTEADGTYTIDWDIITDDVTITVDKVSVTPADPAAQIVSASLTLEGDIGVNYYVIPNDALLADEGAYAQLTYKGAAGDKILLADLTPDADGRYCFTQFVAAKEMTEQITLALYTGEDEAVALTDAAGNASDGVYSVARFVRTAAEVGSEKLQALSAKLASYGAYAKAYFEYEPVAEDTEYADAIAGGDVSAVTLDSVAGFAPVKDASTDAFKAKSISLILKSETILKVTFAGTDVAQYSFTVDGEPVSAVKSGSSYVVQIPNIAAQDLDKEYTIVATNGDQTYTITSYALTYAYQVLKAEGRSDAIRDLVKALYEYNQAANAYFA